MRVGAQRPVGRDPHGHLAVRHLETMSAERAETLPKPLGLYEMREVAESGPHLDDRGRDERLERDLDRHHTIGHAFFMKPRLDRGMLRAVWDRKVYPLIEEYFFDQLDIARKEYTFEAFWPE